MKATKQKGAGFGPETLEREEQETLEGMAHHAAPEWELQTGYNSLLLAIEAERILEESEKKDVFYPLFKNEIGL